MTSRKSILKVDDDGAVFMDDLNAKEVAREFMFGRLFKDMTKHTKSLSRPWINMNGKEQENVTAKIADDLRAAVSEAIDIIASNNRRTFIGRVGKVTFSADGVTTSLHLANDENSHALANVSGAFVTLVIEDSTDLLNEGDALEVDPDQMSAF